MWLVLLSIKRPIFICMIELFLVILGIMGLKKMTYELYPKIDSPVITITTEYPGAGPQEIESEITKLIEEEVNQIGSIERLLSNSREGLSEVIIEFKLDVDIKRMQIEVQDKVARLASKLPKESKQPLIERLNLDDPPIMTLALSAQDPQDKTLTLAYLYRLADQTIKPRLQQIDGIGQIDLYGGREREVQINLDYKKLALWNLSISDIAEAIRRSNKNIPAGEIIEEPRRRSIRVLGEYKNVYDVQSSMIKTLPTGHTLTVADLGSVRDSFKEPVSYARLNGKEVVLFEIKRQSGANVVQVTDLLKNRLQDIQAIMPKGSQIISVYDGSKLIRMSVYDVFETMIIAGLLSVVVVYFFLHSWQSTIITGLALPLSVLTSFSALYVFGFTLNTMTLLGLALAIGLILDDAIVVRENIWRKIEEGASAMDAAKEGTREVVSAVIATSLTVIATFLPVSFIEGSVGKLLFSFAMTICIGMIFSTFDALTMAPMLSAYLISKPVHKKEKSSPLMNKLYQTYKRLLYLSVNNPAKVLLFSFALFGLSIIGYMSIPTHFLPSVAYGEIDIAFEAKPGYSAASSSELSGIIATTIAAHPEVNTVFEKVSNYIHETHVFSTFVQLKESKDRKKSVTQVKAEIQQELQALAHRYGFTFAMSDSGGFLRDQKPIVLTIEGEETESLFVQSEKVLEALPKNIPAIESLTTSLKRGRNEIQIFLNRERMSAFGLNSTDVGNYLRGLYEGETPTNFKAKGEEFDLRIRLQDDTRYNRRLLSQVHIPTPSGEKIPLSLIADLRESSSPAKIVRLNQVRSALFEGEIKDGASLGATSASIQTFLSKFLPRDFPFELTGQAKLLTDLGKSSKTTLALGSLFVYMIMASLYESLILPFTILLTLPLALIGAVFFLLISGMHLDLYAVIGIILLMGLVTKNGILIVDYIEELRREGMARFDAIIKAAELRVRPIMMTSLAMIFGMLPIAIGYGELNAARAGMGIAAIGGLISSTILSLLVVPCSYILLDNLRERVKGLRKKTVVKTEIPI